MAGTNALLTDRDVAQRLAVSVAAVRRWRLEQRGPQFIKVGRVLVRYQEEAVDAWITSRPTGGDRLETNTAGE